MFTTDRNDPRLNQIRENGQQEAYMILSEEERAKGFVRPVRTTYTHVKCGGLTTMAIPIAESYARDPHYYTGTYCCKCKTHFPLKDTEGKFQFTWVDGSAVGS